MAKNTVGRGTLMSWINEFKSKCVVCPFVEIVKYLWIKFKAFWLHWLTKCFLYGLLAIFAITASNLIVVHIYIEFGKTPNAAFTWLPDLVLRCFGTNSVTLTGGGHYAAIVTDMIAICAFIFAVLPIIQAAIYTAKLKRELREEFGFEFVPVKKAGVDDLEEMLKRYRGADELTIFSGGFDWIGLNEELKNLLLDFAEGGKLTLISFRSQDKVKAAFEKEKREDLFEKLNKSLGDRFKFGSGLDGVKCSVIKILGEHRFLFRQSSDAHEFNAGFLGSSKYSRQLLGILFKFVDTFVDTKDWSKSA